MGLDSTRHASSGPIPGWAGQAGGVALHRHPHGEYAFAKYGYPLPCQFPIIAVLSYKADMKIIQLSLFVFLGLALPAQAEVYKCRLPGGGTEISSEPCAGGSTTVKTMQEDVVPEAEREKAERDAERMRQRADQMQAERRADEAADRKEQERLRQASGAPSQAAIQHCLQTLGRMSVDAGQRSELEAGCYATGAIQPVFVQAPQYYGSGYVRPYARPRPIHPIAPLPPDQRPPISQQPKDNPAYKAPGNYRAR
jgi:hypothetical protein